MTGKLHLYVLCFALTWLRCTCSREFMIGWPSGGVSPIDGSNGQDLMLFQPSTGQPVDDKNLFADGAGIMAANADGELVWAIACRGAGSNAFYLTLAAFNASDNANVVYNNKDIVKKILSPNDMDWICSQNGFPSGNIDFETGSGCLIVSMLNKWEQESVISSVFRVCPSNNTIEPLGIETRVTKNLPVASLRWDVYWVYSADAGRVVGYDLTASPRVVFNSTVSVDLNVQWLSYDPASTQMSTFTDCIDNTTHSWCLYALNEDGKARELGRYELPAVDYFIGQAPAPTGSVLTAFLTNKDTGLLTVISVNVTDGTVVHLHKLGGDTFDAAPGFVAYVLV